MVRLGRDSPCMKGSARIPESLLGGYFIYLPRQFLLFCHSTLPLSEKLTLLGFGEDEDDFAYDSALHVPNRIG